jgi:hypothetical protein
MANNRRSRWVSILGAWLFLSCAVAHAVPAGGFEDGIYVYGIFKDATKCPELIDRLKALPLRQTVILSLDSGKEFVLDRPDGEDEISCVLDYLGASGHKTKGLLLQDPVFLDEADEAMRRASIVGQYALRHPSHLAAVQLDVEPYTIKYWGCRTTQEKRDLMVGLQQLLGRVRRQLHGVPLGIVSPWWYPIAGDLPEVRPESLFQVADEIYLMAYGDEGGPIVGGTAERILGRVDAPEFFTGHGRLYIVLATYEFQSADNLQAELATVRKRLASRANFAGTAVFHAQSIYNAPLSRFLSGTVTDSTGQCLAGVQVEAAGVQAETSPCGSFYMSDLPQPQVDITIRKTGYQVKKLTVELKPPGSIKELGKIVLEKDAPAEGRP